MVDRWRKDGGEHVTGGWLQPEQSEKCDGSVCKVALSWTAMQQTTEKDVVYQTCNLEVPAVTERVSSVYAKFTASGYG